MPMPDRERPSQLAPGNLLRIIPRNAVLIAFIVLLLIAVFWQWWWVVAFAAVMVMIGIHDKLQSEHAILRNYPISGHMRFLLESFRPEIRQYFFEGDREPVPFTREQRALVYQRAKGESDTRAFGTLVEVYEQGSEWLLQSIHALELKDSDFRITIGGRDCQQPYSASVFNISAMSFGSLSGNAIQALNRGAKLGNFMHDTGEGSVSRYHRMHGGDLVWEIGSGYFGCRTEDGHFNLEKFTERANDPQIKMIEIKISQGAKPGLGGLLPGEKVTPEIAEARDIPVGEDCHSPGSHTAFTTPRELVHFIALLRKHCGGKPVGFKLCIGHPWEFMAIVKAMLEEDCYPDFIVVDGAEGGTGAAMPEFMNRMGMPLVDGLLLVLNTLNATGIKSRIKVGASGKVISAFDLARILGLGADWANSARGFMFAVGCIQSRACNTDKCPTGVATQDPLRQRALDVADKGERVYHFHQNTLKALAKLVGAAGVAHPDDLKPHHFARRETNGSVKSFAHHYFFAAENSLLDGTIASRSYQQYWCMANPDSFEPYQEVPTPTNNILNAISI